MTNHSPRSVARPWHRRIWLALVTGLVAVLSTTTGAAPPAAATPLPTYTAAVLSPLYQMTAAELAAFSAQLPTLKANGVTAIETDVWWGYFERGGRGAYDWDYYVKLGKRVNAAGLRWVPILSFHECGPNPNDSCRGYGPEESIPIPPWVDAELRREDRSLNACAFVNEQGQVNTEYLAPWCDDIALDWYEEAARSFASTFAAEGVDIQRVHVSMGPSGELRYPSYFKPHGWSYPERGSIQAYSDLAKRSFRSRLVTLYGGVAGVNARWGTAYATIDQVMPPGPGAPRSVDDMYREALRNDRYVVDFWHWYSETLNVHGALILNVAKPVIRLPRPEGLGEKMEVAGKIAGIHWQQTRPGQVRAAEFAAGYWYASGDAPYERLLAHADWFGASVVFTALELPPDTGAPNYSNPARVVRDVAAAADRFDIPLYGENALPINGGLGSVEEKYDRTAFHLFNLGFSGFSLLRMNDLIDPATGAALPPLAVFSDRIGIRPVPVRFTVTVPAGVLGAGESICVTGGKSGQPPEAGPRTELGAWTAEFCTRMTAGPPGGDGSIPFSTSVFLSENRTFDYKYRIVDAGGRVTDRWEPGMTDHNCRIPAGGRTCDSPWGT